MDNTTINGVNVYSFSSRKELIRYVSTQKKSLIAINAEKILHANEQTRSLINQNIGYADGIGAVWALKKKGFKEVVKIPGCELWLDIVKEFYQSKSFYLVGSKEEVIRATVKKLQQEYPGINILGYRNGYIKTPEEQAELIRTIAEQKPDVVFVAMGSPKQELIMQEMQQHHPAIYQGLGGSFDVYIGNVERAPEWWVKNNMEWTYRLIKQPSRIKRQIHLVRFAFLLLIGKY
ncbi:glycosyltransferase [Maribellus luteus]|uniref:Glycosyltransferase n=1 Tax=Maribellus luteus TaxID=2305463 RepID=A0A399SZ33_9BACT|nr:WecB/TagA/CpsF family glycosyltransferase [Maribellus luteus]RIJ47605.1 glycosyltransferase [Maribellus luteus]